MTKNLTEMLRWNSTVYMGYVLIIFCFSAACIVLDDFTVRYFNNYKGLRFGIGNVQVNVTYPRSGIRIPTNQDYLVEELATGIKNSYLINQCLKFEYTALTSGPREIKLLGNDGKYRKINLSMHKGRHDVVVELRNFMDWSVDAYSRAVVIGGPLFVHRMEIIISRSIEGNSISSDSIVIENYGETPNYSVACLRRKESPPHRQFVEYWDSKQNIPFINKNSLGFRRGGYGITKAPNGIAINDDGALFQNLVDDFQRIDLSNRLLRLSVSAPSSPIDGATSIDIKFQYHHDSVVDGAPLSSMYTVMVPDSSDEKSFDIPLSAFPDIRYGDVKRIWIFGPVTIHHIKIVSILDLNRFPSLMTDSDSNIDDLSTWPDNLDHSNMAINFPHFPSEEFNGLKHGFGLNSINRPCYGSGVTLGDGGIELTNDGFIYEQLASANGIYDLSHALLEIEYSVDTPITCGNQWKRRRSFSDDKYTNLGKRKRGNSAGEQISRKLHVLCVVPDLIGSNYRIQPVEFGLLFTEGKRKKITINLSECGPSFAFSIIGHGIVTFHQISLHLSHAGQQQISEVVDDFADWPLLPDSDPIMTDLPSVPPDSMRTQFSHTNTVDDSVHYNLRSDIYDYRQIRQNKMPVLEDLKYVEGHGVEMPENARLIQPLLPNSATSNLIIKYSAAHSATRSVTFVYVANNEIAYRNMHVVFSVGKSLQVVIKVPSLIAHYNALIAVIMGGPLTVHQAKFVEFVDMVELLPGQNTASAILIDDFSNWRVDSTQPNNLDHKLYSLMPNGFGTVTLYSNDQYLIDEFPGKWDIDNLYDLSLQITYTLEHNAVCYAALIPEPLNTMDGRDPYNAFTLHYIDLEFNAGVNIKLTKPLIEMWDNFGYSEFYHGLFINGPKQIQYRLNNPLIIHRIEFIANPEFSEPMIPEYTEYSTEFPIHWTGKIEPTSLNGAIFDQKLEHFWVKLSHHRGRAALPLKMKRGHILRDTYHIVEMDIKDLINKIIVKFSKEDGQDDGGLTREFFTLAANEINKPGLGLFTASQEANHALHINPESLVHENALDQFKHIGRIIGMAILSENLIGIRFVPSLYRKLIDMPIPINTELPDLLANDVPVPDISELEAIDKDKHQHFTWLLNTDISDMSEHLALTMSLNQPHNGMMKIIDLVKNGRHIKVTQSNKNQYVQEYAKWHIIGKVEAQANALRDGVWDVIPRDYLVPFNLAELELLIAGTSTIDVDDWETNTNYTYHSETIGVDDLETNTSFTNQNETSDVDELETNTSDINQNETNNQYSSDDVTIKHFWTCVRGWKANQHIKLLVFVTGSPCLPSAGFKDLDPMFTINRDKQPGNYPRSSTCFNRLYLSPYTEFDVLCERLSFAINETDQFALA